MASFLRGVKRQLREHDRWSPCRERATNERSYRHTSAIRHVFMTNSEKVNFTSLRTANATQHSSCFVTSVIPTTLECAWFSLVDMYRCFRSICWLHHHGCHLFWWRRQQVPSKRLYVDLQVSTHNKVSHSRRHFSSELISITYGWTNDRWEWASENLLPKVHSYLKEWH
jgi:hypothetical protein